VLVQAVLLLGAATGGVGDDEVAWVTLARIARRLVAMRVRTGILALVLS